MRRFLFTGDSHPASIDRRQRYRFFCDKQRTHALAQRTTGVQELIEIEHQRQYSITYLADVQPAFHSPLIKRLYVFELDSEIDPFCVYLFIHQGIEYKSIIRTGTKAQ